jgi:2-oxoisovalerate dehydrogenase E1 component
LTGLSLDIIDLRTITPWDKETVLTSVRKTNRVMILHEDTITAGFGAEIAAVIAQEAFSYLDAPVDRFATPDIPIPYNLRLMDVVVPSVKDIAERVKSLVNY